MKKSVCMCLYIGISYLLFGFVKTQAQIANTALSITLKPFLSVSVNPVSFMEVDESKTEMRAQIAYAYHQSFTHVEVGSNEAFEIQVDHIDLLNKETITLPLQFASNWAKIRVDTRQDKKVGFKILEATIDSGTQKPSYNATIEIYRYTITAL